MLLVADSEVMIVVLSDESLTACREMDCRCFQSGKLVMKMFAKIREYLSNPEVLVIILIDEVYTYCTNM